MTLVESIEALVAGAAERQHLPAVSVAVARDGEVIFAGGVGERNVGDGLRADPDTIYGIASISKQFTVAALMRFVERGELRLDDRVSRYFPWHPYGDTLELHHLLSHTSGMPDYFPLEELDRIAYVEASPREIAEHVLDRRPAFAPGAEYQYCNTAYVLLGALVEQLAGTSYAEHLQTQFFEPLEMTRTGVDDTPTIRSNVTVGYTSFLLGPWELARDLHPSWEFGTGGLYSTVNDLLRWNAALRGGDVVTPESFARMTTPARLNDGQSLNYGLGLSVSTVGGLREVRHTGGLPGISTDNTTYPELGIDIVVFTNHDGCSTYATITRPILALLLDNPALRGPRVPDAAAASGLREHPRAHEWIRAAAAGSIDALPLSAKFTRFLQPQRRARYAELRAYGEPTAITRIDAARRDPETTVTYRVDFPGGPLLGQLATRDDGTIANLSFARWDDRG